MKVLYYYPAPHKDGTYGNPYSSYYREALSKYFRVIDTKPFKGLLSIQLVYAALFRADIYLFNWIENFGYRYLRHFQYLLILFCFRIIKWRDKKLIWMFHNIHPHSGGDKFSIGIMNYLFKYSDLIITHSKEAAIYAQTRAKCKVLYRCHPVPRLNKLNKKTNNIYTYDVLIWGTILPYKGILEFLQYVNNNHIKLHIYIIGKCNDYSLQSRIKSLCSENISYENRYADFQELHSLINRSRYVVFPYIGTSVSSSGALIDTIAMGGNVIGPNKGAFRDLADENCCCVYDDYSELVNLIKGDIKPDKEFVNRFLQENSWDNYVNSIIDEF